MALPLPSFAFQLIMAVDSDGDIGVEITNFGDGEAEADRLVARVDGCIDRGVDGMALEAFLIVAKPGQVHTITQNDVPVAVVVCLAAEPWRAEQAPLPAAPYLGAVQIEADGSVSIDLHGVDPADLARELGGTLVQERSTAEDIARRFSDGKTWTNDDDEHLPDLVGDQHHTEHRFGDAVVCEFEDGSAIAFNGDGWDVMKRHENGWASVTADGSVNAEGWCFGCVGALTEAWTIVDRALASDNAIAHIRAHNATVMPSEERYGTATIYVYTDGSGIAVQGNGYAVVKRIDEDWYTVDRDDNMTDEDLDALNVRTAAFMWVVDCATDAHVEALQAAVSRLENDVVLVDDDGEKTRPLVGVRRVSPGADVGLYWEQRPGDFLRFGDAVTTPSALTELLLNAERAVGA